MDSRPTGILNEAQEKELAEMGSKADVQDGIAHGDQRHAVISNVTGGERGGEVDEPLLK